MEKTFGNEILNLRIDAENFIKKVVVGNDGKLKLINLSKTKIINGVNDFDINNDAITELPRITTHEDGSYEKWSVFEIKLKKETIVVRAVGLFYDFRQEVHEFNINELDELEVAELADMIAKIK